MSDNSFKIEAGRTISHFRLEKLLGEGGMGDVFLAEDLTLSRQVAIKFMRRSMLASLPNPDARRNIEQRFIREAKSAAAINHPNIAQIYEANFDSENWYIAMEFINGSALDEILKKNGPFSANKIIHLMKQTIVGLKFAWDNYKIIHRDIKPQNLMLTQDDYVKIVDLGLAKPIIESSEEELELTGAGVPVGTPYYMAPEQAIGGEIDFQADIFALGASVYELLSGKKAFKGKTPPMIYNKMINKDYQALTEFGVDIQLSALVDKMLEPKKIDRISSYDALLSEIELSTIAHDENASTLIDVRGDMDVNTANDLTQAGTIFGTAVTGSLSDEMATMIDVFLPIDFKINDRYRILKVIGRGNSGIVYKCLDTQLERECSLKSIAAGREYSSDVFPRIKKNFKRLAGLKHKNLVEILDIHENEDGSEIYVVMELLVGQNLLEYFNSITHVSEKVDLSTEAPILCKVARALDSIGQQFSLVHNDLKPVSIFICQDESVKFLDYGVTYLNTADDIHVNDKEIWKYPIADPDYMSPEIWKHQKPSISSDQYSFAVIVYEMLSHKLPFWLKELKSQTSIDTSDFTDLLKLQYERVLEQSPELIDDLSSSENKALQTALNKSPELRFATCEQFIVALTGTGKSSKNLWVAIAAVVVIGGVSFVAMNKSQTDVPKSQDKPVELVVDTEAGLERKRVENAARQKVFEEKQKALHAISASLLQMTESWGTIKREVKDSGKQDQFVRLEKAILEFVEKENIEQAQNSLNELDDFIQAETTRIEKAFAAELQSLESKKTQLELAVQALLFLDDNSEEKLKKIQAKSDNISKKAPREKREALKLQNDELEMLREFLSSSARKNFKLLLSQFDKKCSDSLKKLEALQEFSSSYDSLMEQYKSAKLDYTNNQLKSSRVKFQSLTESLQKSLEEAEGSLKEKVNQTHKELTDKISKLESDKEINPEIALEVDELSVQFRLARALKSERKYRDAYDEYKALGKVIVSLQEKVKSLKIAQIGNDWKIPKLGMPFVWIKQMKIWVAKYEVTNGEYRKFKPEFKNNIFQGVGSLNGDKQPASLVSFSEADAYCKWLTASAREKGQIPKGYIFRLPTAAEWKKYATTGQSSFYPWGNEWPPAKGNFGDPRLNPENKPEWNDYDDKVLLTSPVEKSGGNGWGLFGCSGNVWEWSLDAEGNNRAVFGGSWNSISKIELQTNPTGNYAPLTLTADNIGFRVVLAPPVD